VLHKELINDPGNFSGWIELGLMYKAIEYYDGAEEILLFAEEMRPESSMPNGNLAVLYGWYMGDIENAKIHFDRALEKEPARVALYGQAYEFYKDVVKDEVTALTYVQKGYDITKDPVLGAFLEDTNN
jgi:tetratricopeptide (TPR) repeat protein